jgi:ABC-2 type transport system permease protein
MVIFYPMIFLTGATIPREVMPASIQGVARFLPLDPVVKVLQGMWRGDAWSGHVGHVLFLAGLAVVGSVVAVKTFRWE